MFCMLMTLLFSTMHVVYAVTPFVSLLVFLPPGCPWHLSKGHYLHVKPYRQSARCVCFGNCSLQSSGFIIMTKEMFCMSESRGCQQLNLAVLSLAVWQLPWLRHVTLQSFLPPILRKSSPVTQVIMVIFYLYSYAAVATDRLCHALGIQSNIYCMEYVFFLCCHNAFHYFQNMNTSNSILWIFPRFPNN